MYFFNVRSCERKFLWLQLLLTTDGGCAIATNVVNEAMKDIRVTGVMSALDWFRWWSFAFVLKKSVSKNRLHYDYSRSRPLKQ